MEKDDEKLLKEIQKMALKLAVKFYSVIKEEQLTYAID